MSLPNKASASASTTHELKVNPPYFAALVSGAKTFEIRKNDRAYQRGDTLLLREWHPEQTNSASPCPHGCPYWKQAFGHWADGGEVVERRVSFVYAGDPRFGGLEPGYVVLALRVVTPSNRARAARVREARPVKSGNGRVIAGLLSQYPEGVALTDLAEIAHGRGLGLDYDQVRSAVNYLKRQGQAGTVKRGVWRLLNTPETDGMESDGGC